MARLVDRLGMFQAARLQMLMQRRQREGKSVVKAAIARAVLWSLVNHSDTTGHSFPSIQTIAADADTSVATVKRVVAILREEGIVHVRARNRGVAAGRKRGLAVEGATNLYRLDWDAMHELRDGGSLVHVEPQNTAQAEPCSEPEQGSGGALFCDGTGLCVSHEQGSACAGTGLRLSSRTTHEPPNGTSPLPPEGESGGGGEDATSTTQPDDQTDVEWADRILAAYPHTTSDLLVDDHAAALAAIRRERQRQGGCTPSEIIAAAAQVAATVRSGALQRPLWCRTWLARDGYLGHVRAERARQAAIAAAEARDAARRAQPDGADRWRDELDAVRASLDGMSDEALADLRSAALAAAPEGIRSTLSGMDPRSSPMMQSLMARILQQPKELVHA